MLGGGSPLTTPFLKILHMSEPKSIKELIDTYYPEIAERLRNGERERK